MFDVCHYRQGSVLPLTNLESADRGMYRCIANNNIMPVAYKDTSVYVNVAPSAHFLQSTYGQAANRQLDLTIYCIVEGQIVTSITELMADSIIDRNRACIPCI